eukprot:Gregarina_sp_Poly_1__9941@NODE_655_length_6925_cov_131_526684_g303_i1_p3_GENE_NODE_655_length_6925_cov_131_526684_g303_i1NODE_655_length_6925_cov_131_526684_g303_i1_p3_ORF_typecomplete_len293_score39_07WEMBL/PF05701_11/0_042_NODE_655_length_6925_cov_131_526684_g303_i145235401
MQNIEVNSQLCRGLCYYLYLKRFGIILVDTGTEFSGIDGGGSSRLWDCLVSLNLDGQTKAPLRTITCHIKDLKVTLIKAQDKLGTIYSTLEFANTVASLDIIECRTQLQALLDLLQVSVTLYIKIALQFESNENVEIIRHLPGVFPVQRNFSLGPERWLHEFEDVPFTQRHDRDPRKNKLHAETLALERVLLKTLDDFYQIQNLDCVKAASYRQSVPVSSLDLKTISIQWDMGATLLNTEKQELHKIRDDLRLMQSLQETFSGEVNNAKGSLEHTETNLNQARGHSQEVEQD